MDRSRVWLRRMAAWVLLAACGALMVSLLPVSCSGSQPEGEATIYISAGSSATDIAHLLIDESVIGSEKDFVNKARELGIDEELKPGTYVFQRGEPTEDILLKLQAGLQEPMGVLTVPEGYSISDIAAELAAKTRIAAKEYTAATMADGRTLPLEGAAAIDYEGFLFPSTYDLAPGISAAGLVDEQLATFRERTAGIVWDNAASLGISEYQALIVASMVEREAKVPDERPLVAAVIYNRLAQGMKLEVDATVQYALGSWKNGLTQEDLDIDSPYNTRLYPGLPPGPICNPGLDSIRAALEPASVDYIYYVATGDQEGHHFFTGSYAEFLEMKGSDS